MLELSLFVIVSNVKEGFVVLKKLLFRERIVKVLISSIEWIYIGRLYRKESIDCRLRFL